MAGITKLEKIVVRMKILNFNKHKHKFNRRRALECKFVEKSKNNPGYLKYMVTIGEKDGTKHTQPVYGKDMQDALSRLINKERTVKVEKQFHKNPFLLFIAWVVLMVWPILVGIASDSPHMLLYSFTGIAVLTMLGGLWYNYIEKK